MQNENKIQLFDFEETPVRVIMRDGEPWWVAADVCRVLGLGNVTQAISRLAEVEKMTLIQNEGHSGQRGGAQSYNIINEPGLYRLIFRSDKPEAERFQNWVFHDVLPTLRKTGSYSVRGANITTLFDFALEKELTPAQAKRLCRAMSGVSRMGIVRRHADGENKITLYNKAFLEWLWADAAQADSEPAPSRRGLAAAYAEDRDQFFGYLAAQLRGNKPLVLTFDHVVAICSRLKICREWVPAGGGELSPSARSSFGKWLQAETHSEQHRVRLTVRGLNRNRKYIVERDVF